MQMEEDVGEHHHHAVAAIARRGVTKDAFPNLRVADEIAYRHDCSIFDF
jgi:hypothetical protein